MTDVISGVTAVYGGSFNPPHMGHRMVVENVLRDLDADRFIFLPLGTAPHKTDMASPEDRLRMCELTIEGIEGAEVSDIEVRREGYTYTIDTITALKEMGYEDISYVIGSDILFTIESWRRFTELVNMVRFICIPRPGDKEDIYLKRDMLRREYGADIEFADFTGPDISSTDIRRMIKEGKDTTGLLVEKVRRYIDEKGLYV